MNFNLNRRKDLQMLLAHKPVALKLTLAKRSFISFIKQAWPYVENVPYQHGRHIEVLADQLVKANTGEQRFQLHNLPPRHSKSNLTAVFWPAWTWLQDEGTYPLAGPWVQFMFVSHSDQIASRDSWKCRQLVSSEWYQTLCDKKVTVQGGGIGSWSLATGGARMALSIRTGITGLGADVQVIDDPSDVYKVESAADRREVRTVFFDSLPSRFNHPSKKAQIVTCQRTHRYDLTGMILEDHPEQWEHVCLPAHYDPDHPHRWRGDWRRKKGKLLWPERFTEEALDELARTAYARASQLEQNPRARGGAIFGDANFKIVDTAPSNLRLTRFWDFASTEEGEAADPDYTAGVLGGADKDGIFWVVDVVHARLSPLNRRRRVEQTARTDGKRVAIAIEEEPGSAGKDVIASYKELLRGYAVRGRKATGDKLTRIDPYLAATEAGNVYVLNKPWTREFLREHEEWTGGDDEHDDIIVATAGCHTEASRVLSFKPW